jgi:putative MFS transporter
MAGVLLHFPDFLSARDMHYELAGMPMSALMLLGMALIVGGILVAGYGLFPRKAALGIRGSQAGAGYHLRAMDDAPLSPAHWGLLFVLGVALIIDVMKPATLGFVVPGMREEYGISTSRAALLPLFALTGTVLGSLMWGILSDRLGRRAAILLSSIMFIGTAICGFMPAFGWNLFMCFLMGAAAGGMLPIVYALMAESVPARKRGWLVVLHGGMGTVGGYLVASGMATLLEPHFGWRILWFLNMPTGILMLVLNRWIPESPRFLLDRGQVEQARSVMARYGVTLEQDGPGARPTLEESDGHRATTPYEGMTQLFRSSFLPKTMTVLLYGLGWGIVNWGFITFLPTFLQDAGFAAGSASGLLFLSSVIAIPGTVLVAWLYGLWSSKKSMILYAAATAAALGGFALLDPRSQDVSHGALIGLVVLLLVASGGVISMLSPYTAEVYPTHLRGTGSGLAAGSSKLGGMFGPPLVAALLSASTGLVVPALVVAAPIAISAIVLAVNGVETRGRRLEDISGADLASSLVPTSAAARKEVE